MHTLSGLTTISPLTAMDVPVRLPYATVSKLDECFDVEKLWPAPLTN
jgi:hypothetical protein